jgi:hypothetical protein
MKQIYFFLEKVDFPEFNPKRLLRIKKCIYTAFMDTHPAHKPKPKGTKNVTKKDLLDALHLQIWLKPTSFSLKA